MFEVFLKQPIDHKNPSGQSFKQKIYIGHVDETLPVAFETEGYSRNTVKVRELSKAMKCNQIMVEHRFNGSSKPMTIDWNFLNIKQSADDHHQIVEKLKTIYKGSWVSSGRSKGGMTAIFHRRFYPNDVDATVAFVAPLLFSQDDQRFSTYLNTVGDEPCREKIKTFQRSILLKKDSLAMLLPGYISWINENFNTSFKFSIAAETIIKHSAIDYPFEFWSSTSHSCSEIPTESSNAQTIFDHLVSVVDFILFYTDYGLDFWEGWYYQAQTEIGNYVVSTEHLTDLLGTVDDIYSFGENLVFDPTVMLDIDNWMKTTGDKIILIYGEDDPWSVAQFELSSLDVLKIVNPVTKHETSFSHLNSTNQSLIKQKLSDWLNYSDINF